MKTRYCKAGRKRCLLHGFMILVLTIAGFHLLSCDTSKQHAENCGLSIPFKISYHPGARSSIPYRYSNPSIYLYAVLPFEDRSIIAIQLEKAHKRPVKYISYDKGETWQLSDWKLGYLNLRRWYQTDRLMSHVDHNVLYDCYGKCEDGIKRSLDGGKTWVNVNSVILGGGTVNEIELIETGMHEAKRLYARIWYCGRRDFRCAVSNDYGQSFDFLSEDIIKIVESRANPAIWYGTVKSSPLACFV